MSLEVQQDGTMSGRRPEGTRRPYAMMAVLCRPARNDATLRADRSRQKAVRMALNFHKASFKAAYGTSSQLPPSTLPEVSFAGRSNVGKSSLLNKLMYRKGLAKVSSTPGKTATINFYDVDGADFVDLPGYGYARTSKSEKQRWSDLIEAYFNQERLFALVVSLIDIRHEPSALDFTMIDFLKGSELPFMVALTKADKFSKQRRMSQTALLRKQLDLPSGAVLLTTSAEKNLGIDELRRIIATATEEC